MAVRDIVLAGEELLRKVSKEIPKEEISGEKTQQLIEDLNDTVKEEPEEGFINVGLSAPQIGFLQRVFVLIVPGNNKNPKFKAYINPEIEIISQEMETNEESCLSTPRLLGEVARYRKIRLDYFDEKGEKHSEKLTGSMAIYAQHEMDHLDGILWLDRVKDNKTIGYC